MAADKASRAKFDPAKKLAAQAVATVQQHGVILRALPGDIIGFCPPLIISAEIDDMFNRIEAAFTALRGGSKAPLIRPGSRVIQQKLWANAQQFRARSRLDLRFG